jgi:hypothetical protein
MQCLETLPLSYQTFVFLSDPFPQTLPSCCRWQQTCSGVFPSGGLRKSQVHPADSTLPDTCYGSRPTAVPRDALLAVVGGPVGDNRRLWTSSRSQNLFFLRFVLNFRSLKFIEIIAINLIHDWLRAGSPRGRSSSPGRVKNYLFSKSSRLALRSTQPPIQLVPGALSPGVKRTGREADHSPPTSAEVEEMWIYTSTPPYAFTA